MAGEGVFVREGGFAPSPQATPHLGRKMGEALPFSFRCGVVGQRIQLNTDEPRVAGWEKIVSGWGQGESI